MSINMNELATNIFYDANTPNTTNQLGSNTQSNTTRKDNKKPLTIDDIYAIIVKNYQQLTAAFENHTQSINQLAFKLNYITESIDSIKANIDQLNQQMLIVLPCLANNQPAPNQFKLLEIFNDHIAKLGKDIEHSFTNPPFAQNNPTSNFNQNSSIPSYNNNIPSYDSSSGNNNSSNNNNGGGNASNNNDNTATNTNNPPPTSASNSTPFQTTFNPPQLSSNFPLAGAPYSASSSSTYLPQPSSSTSPTYNPPATTPNYSSTSPNFQTSFNRGYDMQIPRQNSNQQKQHQQSLYRNNINTIVNNDEGLKNLERNKDDGLRQKLAKKTGGSVGATAVGSNQSPTSNSPKVNDNYSLDKLSLLDGPNNSNSDDSDDSDVSSKKRRHSSLTQADISQSNVYNPAIPKVKLERSLKTIVDIWKEYEYGLKDKPPLKLLELEYGTKWRNETESRTFLRRKKIYEAIEVGKQNGMSEEAIIQDLEDHRSYDHNGQIKRKPLSWLCTNLPQKYIR